MFVPLGLGSDRGGQTRYQYQSKPGEVYWYNRGPTDTPTVSPTPQPTTLPLSDTLSVDAAEPLPVYYAFLASDGVFALGLLLGLGGLGVLVVLWLRERPHGAG